MFLAGAINSSVLKDYIAIMTTTKPLNWGFVVVLGFALLFDAYILLADIKPPFWVE
jgi:hypothetical protein